MDRTKIKSICRQIKSRIDDYHIRKFEGHEKELFLISEEGEQSYSDVSLLIQCYLDLCSAFASRKYRLKYDIRGREVSSSGYGYGHR